MHALLDELRYAVRSLKQSPVFVAVAVVTLALAIGANTAVFSVWNAMVLWPVAVYHPDGLAAISVSDVRSHQPAFVYLETFNAFRARQRSFSQLSMYSGGGILRIEAHGVAVDASVEGVMPEYFELVGARPIAGRLLTGADQSISDVSVPVAVISDRLQRRLFGIGSTVVGDILTVDGNPLTIVGVAEPGFAGLDVDAGADFWLPLSVLRDMAGDPTRPIRSLNIVGRLAPGVSLQQAQAEVQARWPAIQAATVPASLSETEQRTLGSLSVTVESVATGFSILRRQYGASLTVLMALTTILLIIGCVNLSGLVLARATRRRQQIAVRIALGASHGRIVQHVLLEVLLLVAAGLAVAALVAWWATRTLTAILSIGRPVPLLRALTPNAHVLIVSAFVSAVTSLLIAALPAWQSVRIPANSMLQRGRTITGWNGRAGVVLLMGQVTLSMVLAVGAGLFARSLAHLRANDVVFRNRGVIWTRIWRKPGDRAPLDATYWRTLTAQLSAIRGVDAVALSQYFPAYLGVPGALRTDTYSWPEDPSHNMPALTEIVSPQFFETFGIQRLQGRDFSWRDDSHTTGVAIVNETAARQLFPAGDRVGRHLRVVEGGSSIVVEVVGVVADAPIGRLREPHQPVVFRPLLQALARMQVPDLHVRFAGDITFVRGEYVRVVQALGHHIVRGLYTLDGWLDFAVLQERLVAQIATYAALLAVLLGCVGIYGLLAYSVAVRVPEIGVRMALGATRVEVIRLIAGDGVRIVAGGVMVGAVCAVAAGRYVQSQLYGLSATDPATIAVAAGVFLFTGLLAAMVPALRGARLDPIAALRSE